VKSEELATAIVSATLKLKKILLCVLAVLPVCAFAQVTLSGSIQSDVLLPQEDSETGATKDEDFQTNTYADIQLQSQHIDAGVRLEYLEHPLPGFENDFKGWGVPSFWAKGRLGQAELTAGTFYEQFGSGFILRTYEERSLGIDNSLLGGRLIVQPTKGVRLKVLSGRQRRYWSWNKSLVSGADAEVSLEQWLPALQRTGTHLMAGASWVNKYEKDHEDVFTDMTHRVNFPKYVNAWDVRLALDRGPWSILAEYAQKSDDPSFANGYIFRKGTVAMFSGTYSDKGLSVLLQAKRSENMSFKSTSVSADAAGISSAINHLPAFTQDHTYALAALYPYATQLATGEWAYQAELGYNFKRKTPLGGRYGMNVKVNYSYVRAIKTDYIDGQQHNNLTGYTSLGGTEGYKTSFFKWGDQTYYQDLDIQLSRRLTRDFKLNLMYMNQRYNKTVIEGGGRMIHADIFVADGMYQIAPKARLRGELQYLSTKQDQGDWAFGLLELSLAPHWMFTVSDMWNCGDKDSDDPELIFAENSHLHYYQGLVTYSTGSHRLQLGYGRTRAGYNCAGGVCRYVPATKGFTLSYNYNF
jgi:hypothetical protein